MKCKCDCHIEPKDHKGNGCCFEINTSFLPKPIMVYQCPRCEWEAGNKGKVEKHIKLLHAGI